MSAEITMPKLSDTMEEGKILRWLKRPGDSIKRGEPLAEVETDKADMVMESFDEGVLDEIKLKEGETAPVGSVIAMLAPAGTTVKRRTAKQAERPQATSENAGASGEEAEAEAAPPENGEPPLFHPAMSQRRSSGPTSIPMPPPPAPEAAPPAPAAGEEDLKVRASPLARRAAEEAGIDISAIRGSGPEGRVTKRDVDNFVREQQLFKFRRLVSPRERAPGSEHEISKLRKSIAHRMAASKREIPHFYVTIEVDMEEAAKLKSSLETIEAFEQNITFNDIVIKACALALERHPQLNSSFADDRIITHPNINIGIAVAIEDGLIVPVIHNCESLSLPEIGRVARKLVAKANRGGFTTEELSGGTFSISNMGMLGVEHFAAVINLPQAAILAVSAIKDRPVVRDGALAIAKTMMVTVSCDHRVIDGVVAGRFLQELKRFLENPASLLI